MPDSTIIDRASDAVGRAVAWLTLVMVLLGASNAVVRYLGRSTGTNLSSNAYLELQWYLFSAIFLLGAAYTLRHDAHVRVDVLYGRVSDRTRDIINLAGTCLLLIPFAFTLLWSSWPIVYNSWAGLEASPDPGGLPRYPIKGVLIVGFGMLALQGFSEAWKCVRRLRAAGGDEQGEPSEQP